jgi:hypothetical protein
MEPKKPFTSERAPPSDVDGGHALINAKLSPVTRSVPGRHRTSLSFQRLTVDSTPLLPNILQTSKRLLMVVPLMAWAASRST